MSTTSTRSRPTSELLDALRRGKATLRAKRACLPLPEKVRAVIALQRACLPLLAHRRPLASWEREWQVEP